MPVLDKKKLFDYSSYYYYQPITTPLDLVLYQQPEPQLITEDIDIFNRYYLELGNPNPLSGIV